MAAHGDAVADPRSARRFNGSAWSGTGGRWLITGSSIALVVMVWYAASEARLVSELFLPHPRHVVEAAWDVLTNGYRGRSLLEHLEASLCRLGAAYLLAVATGVPLGLLSGYCATLQAAVDWMVEFFRPLPPLAYYVLLVIWLGIDDASKIALLYLAALPPIYISSRDGVRGVVEDRLHVARCLGASTYQVFRYVVVPSCLPNIMTGLRVALGFAYTTLVAAEMVAAVSGVGWMVLDAGKFLRSDIVFVGIALMGLTGVVMDRLLRLAEVYVVPWRGKA